MSSAFHHRSLAWIVMLGLYFGLFDLSNNSTIFVAPSASGGIGDATADSTFVDQILQAVEGDLCIDTSRVDLEGFSQGGAMVAVLACGHPGIFHAAVGHSRGGLTAPTTCQPIPYLGSRGLSDVAGNSQATQTDPFAKCGRSCRDSERSPPRSWQWLSAGSDDQLCARKMISAIAQERPSLDGTGTDT